MNGRLASTTVLLAVSLIGCSEDGLIAGTRRGTLSLRLQADVGRVLAPREVEVTVFYTHADRKRVPILAPTRFSVDTGITQLPALSVDIAKCLGDPEREGGAGCPLSAGLTLIDPTDGPVDSVVVGPVNVTGKGGDSTLSMPPAVLRRAHALRLPDSVRVYAGDTITVGGSVLDAAGDVIAGRLLAWSTGNAAIATTTPSGLTTAVAGGRGTLTAMREGLSGTVPVSVPVPAIASWRVGPRLGTIGGGPMVGFVYGINVTANGAPQAFPFFQSCIYLTTWQCSSGGFRATTVVSSSEVWGTGNRGRAGRFNGSVFVEIPGSPDNVHNVAGAGPRAFASVNDTLWDYDGSRWNRTTFGAGQRAGYRSIWAVSDRNAFAVGDSNVVARFDGTTWGRTVLPSTIPGAVLLTAWAFDSSNVFAGGQAGFVWRFDGAQWRPMHAPVWEVLGLHGASPSDLYAAASVDSQSVLMRWNGAAWAKLANFPYQIHRVYAVGDGRVLVAGEQGFVAVYQAGNVTALSASHDLTPPSVTSVNHAAVAGGNEVWVFDGSSWNALPPPWRAPYFGYPHSVWSSGPNDVFLKAHVRPCDAVLHFNGSAWRRVSAFCDAAYGQIVGLGAGDVLVIRNRWDGSKWNPSVVRCSPTACLPHVPETGGPWEFSRTVWASGPTNVFTLGSGVDSQFYAHRYDGRSLATRSGIGSPNAVSGVDSATVFGFTSRALLRYNFATGDWDLVPQQRGGLGTGWAIASDDIYATSCSVLRFNGRWWRTMTNPANRCIGPMMGSPSGGAIAVTSGSTILYGVGPNGAFQGPPGASAGPMASTWSGGARKQAPAPSLLARPPKLDVAGRLMWWPTQGGRGTGS